MNMNVGIIIPYNEENKKLVDEKKLTSEIGTPLEALYDYINALELQHDEKNVIRQLKADLMVATGRIQEAQDGTEE